MADSTETSAPPVFESILLFAILLVAPVSLELWRDGSALFRAPLADAGVWAAVLTIGITSRRRLARVRSLPGPFLACAAAALAGSVLQLGDQSVVEVVQRLNYVCIAAVLFQMLDPRTLVTATTRLLPIVTLGFAAVAAIQVFVLDRPPWLVHSLFEDNHGFGAWSGMVLALVGAQVPRSVADAAMRLTLIALTCITLTTVFPVLGLAVGVLSSLRAPSSRRWPCLAVGCAVLFVALAPRSHFAHIVEAWRVTDVATVDELHSRGAEIDSLLERGVLFGLPGGELTVRSPSLRPATIPDSDRRRYEMFTPNYPDQRFLEGQAALFAATQHPVAGAGLGSYQREISANYLTFRKLKSLRPNSQSGWLIEMVETGIVGVLAILFLFLRAIAAARQNARGPGAALAGGLTAAAVIGLGVPVFQTPLMLVIVLLGSAALTVDGKDP